MGALVSSATGSSGGGMNGGAGIRSSSSCCAISRSTAATRRGITARRTSAVIDPYRSATVLASSRDRKSVVEGKRVDRGEWGVLEREKRKVRGGGGRT